MAIASMSSPEVCGRRRSHHDTVNSRVRNELQRIYERLGRSNLMTQ